MKKRITYRERTYLSGPMDMAKDLGFEWRNMLTPKLKALGIIVEDPITMTMKTLKVPEFKLSGPMLREIRRQDEDRYHQIMMEIERHDLRAVEISDFVITFWDWQVVTYGTSVENDTAARNGIPIYCVSYSPEDALPNWLLKDIWKSGGALFGSFDELLKFLQLRKNIIVQYKGHKPPAC